MNHITLALIFLGLYDSFNVVRVHFFLHKGLDSVTKFP